MLSTRNLILAPCLLLFALASVHAQATQAELQWVNGEWERYWRVLQVGGDVPEHPWSSRPFGSEELLQLRATGAHPWAGRVLETPFRFWRIEGATLPVEVKTIFNTSFPFGFNEGPVWAGRGLTTVLSGGNSFVAGPLSASFAPLVFDAQNTSFALLANGLDGRFAFGMPAPGGADMPQRFGDKPYRRLDPGNSFIRLDVGPVAAGFSTAAQHWGPARDHPLILGNNAGGFPHVFLGTAHPVQLGPIRIHGRTMWGKLYESRYTFMEDINPYRFAAGAVVVVVPVDVPGLEIGAGRFIHVFWSKDVLRSYNLTRPFGKLLGFGNAGPNVDNQLVSVFARWVFPQAGVEAYGEFAREDGNVSYRHLLVEPDHDAGYLIGLQRVWGGGGGKDSAATVATQERARRRTVVRLEVLNTRIETPHLTPPENPFYTHSPIGQGHTYLGQALGSAGGFGGGAASLAFDRYTPAGRWSVTWTRLMRGEYLISERNWVPIPQNADVFHALGLDGIVFRGRTALTYELTGVYELNRNFQRDAFNLRAASGVRFAW
jgi:hypothetical protein